MANHLDTTALEEAAVREISKGLTACQVAVARDGEVLWTDSFGSVTADTRFWIASATKPIVSSAIFALIGPLLIVVNSQAMCTAICQCHRQPAITTTHV